MQNFEEQVRSVMSVLEYKIREYCTNYLVDLVDKVEVWKKEKE